MRLAFDNSYSRLPERFYAAATPARYPAPKLIRVNHDLASQLGLDATWLESADGLAFLSGQEIADGSTPIALAYAGHQFGNFVPQLGDGRAILLGEIVDRQGVRRDMQLKGAGRTAFSRGGDGRAAIGPVLREYLVSEAMAALGVPTTRTLAAVTTGEPVRRETLLPGAVLTRIAASHIRVGTFEYFAARSDSEALRLLADHVIARHYPAAADSDCPYRALLDAVIAAQAELVARWLGVGFIHGVMNTDNMAVSGETIDYGPCAFMDHYDPATVFSSIDRTGRYAYGHQPQMAHWDLARLAEALLALLGDSDDAAIAEAQDAIAGFAPRFDENYRRVFRAKLGLVEDQSDDPALIADILAAMVANQVDFTLFFRRLSQALADDDDPARELFVDPTTFDGWAIRWRARLDREPRERDERRKAMDAVNPAFIPRNHRVEAMIEAAIDRDDFSLFDEMMALLARPYDDQPALAHYAAPPEPHERVQATFCGT